MDFNSMDLGLYFVKAPQVIFMDPKYYPLVRTLNAKLIIPRIV